MADRMAFIGIDDDDLYWLRRIGQALGDPEESLRAFYDHLRTFDHLASSLQPPERVERLLKSQRKYFTELTQGPHDGAYYFSRLMVGWTHLQQGIEPRDYVGSFAIYATEMLRRIDGSISNEDLQTATKALLKVLFLDLGIVLEAYFGAESESHQVVARLFRLLSGVNAAVLRASDRYELFRTVCETAVAIDGLESAWIGLFEEEAEGLFPVAEAPANVSTLDGAPEGPSSASRSGLAAARAAAQTGKTVFHRVSGLLRDHPLPVSLDETPRLSWAAIPIGARERTDGVLVLGLSDQGWLTEGEGPQVVEEIGLALSFALDRFETARDLDYLATRDLVTGLPSRLALEASADQILRRSAESECTCAMVVIAIDQYPEIACELSEAGNAALLQEVGSRIEHAAEEHALVAALHRGAFAVFLPDGDRGSHLTGKLRHTLSTTFSEAVQVEGELVQLRGKIGIALAPEDGSKAATLIERAITALGQSDSRSPASPVFFSRQQQTAWSRTRKLEIELRQAIDTRQFELHYQPIFEVHSRRIVSAEALLRWRTADGKNVSPADFIPVLEESGMMDEVGRWVLERALQDRTEWIAAGLGVSRIAVNVSPIQLEAPDFVDHVLGLTRDHHLAEGELELEITESALVRGLEDNHRRLQSLLDAGIRIAIDDFGTGYSSLSYLQSLPASTLKIDRSFVSGLPGNQKSRQIVDMILGLAHSLRLEVVAEGIETEEQLVFLKTRDCDLAQGFLLARPCLPESLKRHA